MSLGRGQVGEELSMILLCHEMKWDYFTYKEQPSWFIASLRLKLTMDARHQQAEQKKAERKAKQNSRRR